MNKLILALAAVMFFGCVTSNDGGGINSKYNSAYQSTDNQVTLTIEYPNWSAYYYAKSPSLHVSGRIDSIKTDSVGVFYTTRMFFGVQSFYQTASDGTRINTDSSVVQATGFTKEAGAFATSFAIETKVKDSTTFQSPNTFSFTGHPFPKVK